MESRPALPLSVCFTCQLKAKEPIGRSTSQFSVSQSEVRQRTHDTETRAHVEPEKYTFIKELETEEIEEMLIVCCGVEEFTQLIN